MKNVLEIRVAGGAYNEREHIKVRHYLDTKEIEITGFYDGCCNLEVEIKMPVKVFLKKLELKAVE